MAGEKGSFKFKVKRTWKIYTAGKTEDDKIAVLLKYLSKFCRILEMILVNHEVNIIVTLTSVYVITISTGAGAFAMTDTKLYVLGVTL